MKFITIVTLFTLFFTIYGQDWAKRRLEQSPRHQEWLDIEYGNRKVKCFIVYPERKMKAPAIIVIHEIMGLTDWVMSVADQLAENGYIAIAPDLLSGMAPGGGRTIDFTDVGKVREAISALPRTQITRDLNAVSDYAKKLPSCNGKIAVAGFCWGGTQSFLFATERADLSAAFVFYGTGPEEDNAIARINCPVYGFYGENDNRVNATIPETEKKMKVANKIYKPVIYTGAGHGFMRAGEAPDANEANKKARTDAWKRWLELLSKL